MTAPPWVQLGITDVPAADRMLAALRAPDSLVVSALDGEGDNASAGQHFRGHGIHVGASVVTATPISEEVLDYHRSLGLGPARVFCPAGPTARTSVVRLVLKDAALCERLRADRGIARLVLAYNDAAADALVARLGLTPAWAPPSAAYDAANDKLALAEAASRYGFEAVPMRRVTERGGLEDAFRALHEPYGAGCILRLRRGSAGRDVHYAPTLRAARRVWRRLRARGDVLVSAYVPATRILRNVATHGFVTAAGFAPLFFSEQIIRRHVFRGGLVEPEWKADEIAPIRRALAGIAGWLRDLGYVDAPAGIDGFLVEGVDRPRFLALDPNIRMTGMMFPWAAVVALSERAGRGFVWQFEARRMLGVPLTLARFRRHFGEEFLRPEAPERGGVLPTFLTTRHVGPVGSTFAWLLLLGRDAAHLAHLRARVGTLGLVTRP